MDPSDNTAILFSERQARDRSLLLYMAGDNDLSDAGIRDVDELCREGSSPGLYIGVEIDTRGEHTGSIRYEITEPEYCAEEDSPRGYRMVIERRPEGDTGKPKTLLDFLGWGVRRYPAQETILVVGGHGTGFRHPNRSIAIDENGSGLDMAELEFVFSSTSLALEQNRLGILGFDACLMGMLEVAAHLRPYAKYLIASQHVEPGEGWPYDKVVRCLKTQQGLRDAAACIADAYVDHYRTLSIVNVTQSVIDLDETDAAMATLGELGTALSDWIDVDAKRSARLRALGRTRSLVQTFRDAEYVDVRDLARLLDEADFPANSAIKSAASDLIAALNDCVVSNCVPEEARMLNGAYGLSIWFPATLYSYTVHRQRYLQMQSVNDHRGWLNFLDRLFSFERG